MATVPIAQPSAPIPASRMPLPSLGAMIGSEWLKLRARAVFWWTLGAVALIAIAVPIIGYIIERTGSSKVKSYNGIIWPRAIEVGGIVSGALSILPILVSCLVIGSEYQWGTMRVIIGSGASRTKLVFAKLITMVIYTAIFVLVAMAAATISGTLVGVIAGESSTKPWTYDGAFFLHIVTIFLIMLFVLLVTVVIGFTLTLLTRSLATGIALAIAVNFLDGIVGVGLALLGHVGRIIQDGLPSMNISKLTAAATLSPDVSDTGRFVLAIVILALYIVILSAISVAVFRRRDIQAGS